MSMLHSILQFIKKHRWLVAIAAVVLLPIAAIAFYAFTPTQASYITAIAEKGDLRQTVEAVGTVISERDLELQFPMTGIVAQIFVKEGDIVQQGQRLAALRSGNLAADIASASARLQAAEADYMAKVEGSRPEDIAIAEAEVDSKRASLESAKSTLSTSEKAYAQSEDKLQALRNEALTSLIGYVSNVGSTVSKEVTTAINALSAVKDILDNNDVTDAVIKASSADFDMLNASLRDAERQLNEAYRLGTPLDYERALDMLQKTKYAVTEAWDVTNRTFNMVSTLPQTDYFTDTQRETYKTSLTAQRTNLQTSLNNIDTATKTLRDASANFTTRIATEESSMISAKGAMDKAKTDIVMYEASLRISEAQLQLKRAPARKTDLDASAANVRQARAALQRAQADFGNTVITAPITGRVTKVNVKPGEIAPVGPALTMLGNSPFRVEMYVSEIDIPKVIVTQSGSVELDAFSGKDFQLRVSEVDTAPTNRDGVNKYRVRLDFVYPHDELKIGMTGDATIVTGIEKDVVQVPVRAILERENGDSYVRILGKNGTVVERDVQKGLEGEGSMISVDGVEEGDTIIVLEKK